MNVILGSMPGTLLALFLAEGALEPAAEPAPVVSVFSVSAAGLASGFGGEVSVSSAFVASLASAGSAAAAASACASGSEAFAASDSATGSASSAGESAVSGSCSSASGSASAVVATVGSSSSYASNGIMKVRSVATANIK